MKICDRCGSKDNVMAVSIIDTGLEGSKFSADLCKKCYKQLIKLAKDFVKEGKRELEKKKVLRNVLQEKVEEIKEKRKNR